MRTGALSGMINRICTVRSLLLIPMVFTVACQSSRDAKEINIENDNWLFTYDSTDGGIAQRWYSDSCDRSSWTKVRSGYWSDEKGSEYDGTAWYASAFEIGDSTRHHSIVFGGVDDDAEVWVNGKEIGMHSGYDDPFYFDLSETHRGRNALVVRVVDRGGPGGLYEPVRIAESGEVKQMLKSKFADKNARGSAEWVRDAIIYEVYLRSFSREGTFKGLEKRLPELESLGVSVLWLTPIHPVGDLGRKGKLGSPYAVQDYYEINPEFGTLDDFKSLVESVHRLGMRIIIDLVANHTSWDSRLIFEHPEWFKKNKEGLMVSPNADWTDVAQLDYQQHELRKYMINMMVYWVRDVGIDGFRCDVADLVPLDFWESARQALDVIKPVMMLAEGKNPEDHLDAFDLTYSWNMYEALGDVINGKKSVKQFDEKFEGESLKYPKSSLRLRFSSNHDKNVQDGPAVKLYTSGGAKAAAAFMFTIPGVPLIYNGDEVGNPRKLDLLDRVDIEWNKGKDFRELYATLDRLRTEHPALLRGKFKRLWCSDSSKVYAFQRSDGDDVLNIVINFSDQGKVVRIDSERSLVDVVSHKTFAVQKKNVELKLRPYGFFILIPSEEKERK